MAVQEQTPYIEYVANGSTTSFPIEFDCDDKNHLIVTVNDLDTQLDEWAFENKAVKFKYPPFQSSVVKIWRNTPLERTTTYQTYNNSLHPEVLNTDFDKVWIALQEFGVKHQVAENKLKEFMDSIVDGEVNGLPSEILARIDGDEKVKNFTLNAVKPKADKIYVDERVLDGKEYDKTFDTEVELKAFTPATMDFIAKAWDTFRVFRYVGGVEKWKDLGLSELELAKNYTQETINSQRKGILQEDDILVAITDKNNNKTWLQANSKDGGPTQEAREAIREAVSINAEIKDVEEDALLFLKDRNGNLTQLFIRRSDGKFPDFVVQDFKERMNLGEDVGLDNVKTINTPSDFQVISSVARGIARHVGNIALPPKVYTFTNSTGQNNTITLPNNYSDATPLILVICFEGRGDYTNLNIRTAYSDVLNHGVVWARSNFHGNSYGSPQCMQDALELYQKACEIAPIGGVVIVGNSMGGIAAQNAILTRTIPNVLGLYMTDPTYDMYDRYVNGRASDINSAYDCNVDTYTKKTAGYDPALRHWSEYQALPIRILATSKDNTVKMIDHTNKLKTYLSGHNDVDVTDTLANGHNAAAQFNVTELLNFINKCANGTIKTTI